MIRLQDKAFQLLFSKCFVYNILFEDAEVDEQFLGLEEDSNVLSITGAGCGVAGMMSKRPRSIDAVDINPHHLSIAAMKMTAAQHMASYTHFYDLCGRGWQSSPKETIQELGLYMPVWIREYWKKHYKVFRDTMYHHGLTAEMLHQLRKRAGLNAQWLRAMMGKTIEDRMQMVEDTIAPILHSPIMSMILRSPLQLVALGVNFAQRDRLLATEQMDSLVSYFVEHIKRVASTDLETNWFAWYSVAGQYNHEHPDAVPPYLRRDRHERSYQSPTSVRYHNTNIFDVMGQAGPQTWSHYTLCDAPDWMPEQVQKHLLKEILRTSRDGATVLVRSVEKEPWVCHRGMDKHFKLREEDSRLASELDRSRQYQSVQLYQVAH